VADLGDDFHECSFFIGNGVRRETRDISDHV
jgi:hypothetical protein